MEIIPIIAILSSFGTAVLIVYFVTRARQRRVELQAEMQSKLIDRFGSAPEMVTFLQSPQGREFIAGVQTAPAVQTRDRVLGGFTRSIILTALGAAFLFLTFWDDRDFVVPAAIILSLGLGYFVATVVSWRLSASLSTQTEDITRA
jgi:hypothetical protein